MCTYIAVLEQGKGNAVVNAVIYAVLRDMAGKLKMLVCAYSSFRL